MSYQNIILGNVKVFKQMTRPFNESWVAKTMRSHALNRARQNPILASKKVR